MCQQRLPVRAPEGCTEGQTAVITWVSPVMIDDHALTHYYRSAWVELRGFEPLTP